MKHTQSNWWTNRSQRGQGVPTAKPANLKLPPLAHLFARPNAVDLSLDLRCIAVLRKLKSHTTQVLRGGGWSVKTGVDAAFRAIWKVVSKVQADVLPRLEHAGLIVYREFLGTWELSDAGKALAL